MAGSEPTQEDLNVFQQWVRSTIFNPQKAYRAMFYTGLVFFLFMTLFPFYWLFVLTLTPNNDIFNMGLLPKGFHVESFIQIFDVVPFHIYMLNSLILAVVTTAIVLVVGSLAGYVFGRFEFRGKRVLLLFVLITSYFPPVAFFIPLFRFFTGNFTLTLFGQSISSPQLFNTPGPLIVPYTALFMPLAIFILMTFYSQIPDGLEEAARVEGATRIGALFRVIIPLSAPGVATAGVLTFIGVYNEFFFAFLMTDGQAQHWGTIVWGLTKMQTQYQSQYNLMAAASILGVIPVAGLIIMAQEKIISGLTAGALKE